MEEWENSFKRTLETPFKRFLTLSFNCDTLPHQKTLTRLGKTSHENTPPCKSGGFHLKGYEMKKYIPLDFDEKGKVILGNAKKTPTPNGTIPAIFILGGSDDGKQGLKSISITPAITTTPAIDSRFPIYYDDLTEEERTEGVHIYLNVESGIIHEGDKYTLTYTPTEEWYAFDANTRTFGEKGEPMTMLVTAELNDRLVFNNFAVMESDQPDENTKIIDASISIQV